MECKNKAHARLMWKLIVLGHWYRPARSEDEGWHQKRTVGGEGHSRQGRHVPPYEKGLIEEEEEGRQTFHRSLKPWRPPRMDGISTTSS
jgi:hypothetical protein